MNMINVDTIEYFKSAIAKPINPLQRRFYTDALLALEKQIAIEARWEGDSMGIKKALDVLDNVKVFWSPSQIQEIELAIQALKKQIPLQVGDIQGDYEYYYDCMICGEITNYEHQKYCIQCGQRLDW